MGGEGGPPPPGAPGFSRDQLTADLRTLGVQPGQDLLIHSSLRQVGRTRGGAATLLDSVMDVAGPEATLVVPAHTALNSFSSRSFRAAVAGLDARQRARFIAAMPGFDPSSTSSVGMGAFAEYVRTRPEAARSTHPQTSFAALGPGARACTFVHDLDCHLGERSPLGWLYDSDAAILLLGVSYLACTAFHLAEYRLPGVRSLRRYRCFTAAAAGRTERVFTALDLDDSDFGLLGEELDAAPFVQRGRVGSARCRLLPFRAAVDFARVWLEANREQAVR